MIIDKRKVFLKVPKIIDSILFHLFHYLSCQSIRLAAEVVEQGLGFVGPSVRLISYSIWSGNTFSGFSGTETNIIIQYVHCSGWMTMDNMVFMEASRC